MADRIGAFRQIVPVISHTNDPPIEPPVEGPEEPGISWSRQSAFKYTLPFYDVDPHNDPTMPKGMRIKDAPKHEYVTRVERLAPAVEWKTMNYMVKNTVIQGDGSTSVFDSIAETWREMWFLLNTETVQEIMGSIRYANGSVIEKYRTVEIERYLHVVFTKRPSTPNVSTDENTYGELPP